MPERRPLSDPAVQQALGTTTWQRFMRGVLSAFTVWPVPQSNPYDDDAAALEADWRAVGDDIRQAMDEATKLPR